MVHIGTHVCHESVSEDVVRRSHAGIRLLSPPCRHSTGHRWWAGLGRSAGEGSPPKGACKEARGHLRRAVNPRGEVSVIIDRRGVWA